MAYPSQPPPRSPYDQPMPQRAAPRSRRPLVIALVAAIALVVVGTAVYWFGFSDITIKGTITLPAGGTGYGNVECHGSGAYAGLTGGAPIEIMDGGGKTIALGQLGPGKVTDTKGCVFAFSVDAPRTDIYVLRVSRQEVLKFSRADAGRDLAITVGG